MDEKDFKQAMKWFRRAPVTHVAPDSGSMVSPQKKDISQREKARVWFPRPAACSMGMKPGSQSSDETKHDSAYGALAVYREKQVMVHGPAEKVDQPESMNAPEVPLADTMTEDNPPYDVDYTVVSDEDEPLQLGMSADEAPADSGEADDPFAGMIASVETGISGMLAEKPAVNEMLAARDGDDDEVAEELAGLSEEELAEIAGFDLSLLKEDDETAAASEVMAALSEEELAEIAGFDPALLLEDGEPAASADDVEALAGRDKETTGGELEEDASGAQGDDAADAAPEAAIPEARAFEAAAEAALMDALIADEAAAQAEEKEAVVEAPVAEVDDTADAPPETALPEASAFEAAAEAALMDALIADEAAAQAEEAEVPEEPLVEAAAETESADAVSDEMVIGEASGFDALVEKAEEEAQEEAVLEAVLDPEPDVLSEAEEVMTAREVDLEEALSAVEAVDVADFDPAIAEDILAEVLPEAVEASVAEEAEKESADTVSGEMRVGEASGFDALVEEAEEEAREEAVLEAVLDPEPDVLSEAEEAMTAREVDLEEALSAVEAVDPAIAEDILSEVIPEAAEEQLVTEEAVAEAVETETVEAEASPDEMVVGEASGFNGLVEAAEDEAREDAVPDPQPDVLSGVEAALTAQDAGHEEVVSEETAVVEEQALVSGEADFDPAMAEDILAGMTPEAAEEPVVEAAAEKESAVAVSDEMVIGEASGFDALVEEAEEQAREDAVPDTEPELLSDAEVVLTAQNGGAEEAALEETGAAEEAVASSGEADFDPAAAGDIPAEVMPEAVEAQLVAAGAVDSGEMLSGEDEATLAEAQADVSWDEAMPEAVAVEDAAVSASEEDLVADAPQAETAGKGEPKEGQAIIAKEAEADKKNTLPAETPDPENALADGILMVEGETPPDFEVPRVPVLDEMTTDPEVAIPEEQVFRDKIETHQRNKMAFAEYKVAAAYAREDTQASRLEALKWYTRAAENGHAVSQFNLGNIYYAGRGVEKDYTLAADWYELAAAQGVARAQDNLGLMYFHGRGRPVEPEMAVYWFRQAAIQGYAPAQYKLAMHLEAGVGTEPDLEEALHWYKKAASQGDAKAQKDVVRLMGQKEA